MPYPTDYRPWELGGGANVLPGTWYTLGTPPGLYEYTNFGVEDELFWSFFFPLAAESVCYLSRFSLSISVPGYTRIHTDLTRFERVG